MATAADFEQYDDYCEIEKPDIGGVLGSLISADTRYRRDLLENEVTTRFTVAVNEDNVVEVDVASQAAIDESKHMRLGEIFNGRGLLNTIVYLAPIEIYDKRYARMLAPAGKCHDEGTLQGEKIINIERQVLFFQPTKQQKENFRKV